MKQKDKRKTWSSTTRVAILTSGVALSTAVLSVGCGNDEDASPNALEQTFNDATSRTLQAAIVQLPSSLTGAVDGSSTKATPGMYKASTDAADEEGSTASIYGLIRTYVNMAESLKDFVTLIVVEIVKSPVIYLATIGEPFDIDSDDPEAPTKVLIEQPDGEAYDWKVSLWLPQAAADPNLIVRFTVDEDGAKGRMLWTMTETDETALAAGLTIEQPMTVDVTFDGTVTPKTLEVRYVGDLSDRIAYGTAHWSTMNETERRALDLGRPEKLVLEATYDGAEFTINGASYHRGWVTEHALKGEDMFWGEGRTMYSFKARAIESPVSGAKMHLALPMDSRTDTSGMWDDSSIGALYTDIMVDEVNGALAEADDPCGALKWVLGDDLAPEPLTAETTITQAEWDAFTTHHASTTDPDLQNLIASSLEDVNNYFATLDDPTREDFYVGVTLPHLCDAHGTVVTKDELQAFVDRQTDDADANHFKQEFQSIAFIINPAFYRSDTPHGFVGTYDAVKEEFYAHDGSTLAKSSDHSLITDLIPLDLSALVPIVPAQVKATTIAVQ